MNALAELKSDTLRDLFLRDEIPEAMYWLRNEGIGEGVDPELLDRFIWTDVKVDRQCLESLVAHGLLRRTQAGRYELTEAGLDHGARLFEDDFAEFELATEAFSACACGCCGAEPEPESEIDGIAPTYSACACGCCSTEPESEGSLLAASASCGCSG